MRIKSSSTPFEVLAVVKSVTFIRKRSGLQKTSLVRGATSTLLMPFQFASRSTDPLSIFTQIEAIKMMNSVLVCVL